MPGPWYALHTLVTDQERDAGHTVVPSQSNWYAQHVSPSLWRVRNTSNVVAYVVTRLLREGHKSYEDFQPVQKPLLCVRERSCGPTCTPWRTLHKGSHVCYKEHLALCWLFATVHLLHFISHAAVRATQRLFIGRARHLCHWSTCRWASFLWQSSAKHPHHGYIPSDSMAALTNVGAVPAFAACTGE